MTDIEMLPLPTWMERYTVPVWEMGVGDQMLDDLLHRYARAVAEHNVKERDAEIERLRAEVDAVWASMPRDARYLDPPDGGCVPLHEQVRRMAADAARAERLAEALQWYAEQAEGCRKIGGVGEPFRKELDRDGGKRARAALRDHDKETKK